MVPGEVIVFGKSIAKRSCQSTLEMNANRIPYFKGRMDMRNLSKEDVVIAFINVDDPHGTELGETLMPNENWQVYRDREEVPFARGLVERKFMEEFLATIDEDASTKLQTSTDLSVVIVDYGVAEVYSA